MLDCLDLELGEELFLSVEINQHDCVSGHHARLRGYRQLQICTCMIYTAFSKNQLDKKEKFLYCLTQDLDNRAKLASVAL